MNMNTKRRNQSYIINIFAAALIILPNSACTNAVVGAGATTGLAIYDERNIKTIARDTLTATRLRAKMLELSADLATKIGIDVHKDRVLLTGAIADEKMMSDAVRIAWSIGNVLEVINEIQLTDTGIVDMARDGWITMQFRAHMALDEKIFAVNYLSETVNGVVYIIGIAQNNSELERVINLARGISHVRKIVNHVQIKKPTS